MLSTKMKGTLAGAILATGLAASATTAQAATFAVNNTNNNGAGSLRSAINAAEGTAAADNITFSIPGAGPHTITPTTPLPTITQPLKIKGYSEPGATAATANSSAVIMIVIDAVNVARGLDIGGDDIEVRGLNVQRAQATGVFVEGRDNVVAGNFIGTGVAGLVARPNGDYGVELHGQDNRIGGSPPADRNVISSNGLAEVYVDNGSGHIVQGNRIGTGAGGVNALGNQTGVLVESDGNEIRDNLISGELNGVNVYSDDNVLQGNLIGTNPAGDAAVENFVGMNVIGGDDNQIGGTAEGESNVISGNDASGLQLILDGDDPAENNKVEGNLIGVTAAGDVELGNGSFGPTPGVVISGSVGNTIGGSAIGAGNVIAANGGDGIGMIDGADDNSVLGNWIGTDAGATLDLGNGGSGVDIEGDENRVGDPDENTPMNTIAHNGDDGVTVTSGIDNAILRNSIFVNDELGIDLDADGTTANDPVDADAGANNLQNGPEIDSATATSVDWELESDPKTRYRLEFYANDTCDPSGSGEAQTYLGSTFITTDANGDADGSTVTPTAAGAGKRVSMTATRLDLQLGGGFPPAFVFDPRSTSELSPCELTV